jgi:hypothetical protein
VAQGDAPRLAGAGELEVTTGAGGDAGGHGRRVAGRHVKATAMPSFPLASSTG